MFVLEDGLAKRVHMTAKLRQLEQKLVHSRVYRLTYLGELPMGSGKYPMSNFALDEVLDDAEMAEQA